MRLVRWSFVMVAVGLTVVAAACSPDRTEEAPPRSPGSARSSAPVPEARTEVGATRVGDRVYVIGGLRAGTEGATDRVDVYDLAGDTWSEGPPLPRPLHHAGVTTFRGRVVVAGGYVTDGGAWVETDDVWSLGTGERSWRAEPPLLAARGALGLAATADRLLAFGGTSAGQVVATAEVLFAGADAWRTAPPLRQPREHLAAASAGGRIYAIGGRVGGLDTNLTSVESIQLHAFAAEWRPEPALTVPRGGTAATSVDGEICVAGGEAPAGTIAEVECLRGGAWRTVAALSEPRHGLGVVAGAERMLHVLGGGPQPGLTVSAAHEVVAVR